MQSLYGRRVFPWLNDRLCSAPELMRIRSEALAGARGRTIEIGFGTGLGLAYYPAAVSGLVGVEPNDGMLDRAGGRIREAAFPVEVVRSAAEALPLPDRTFDTGVSVLTLCTVAEPPKVLAELRRVLKEDGRLIVLEHGLAEEPGVARWQRRLDWLQGRLACGCHLTRPVGQLLHDAGFRFEDARRFFAAGLPRTHGWLTVGTAVKA